MSASCAAEPAAFSGCFWSVDGAWGLYRQSDSGVRLEVAYGALDLDRLGVPAALALGRARARVGERAVACALTTEGDTRWAQFAPGLRLVAGEGVELMNEQV